MKDTSTRFKFLRLFNVGQLRDYQVLTFVLNCVLSLVPEIYKEFYRFSRSSVHEHATRRCDNLVADMENSVRSDFTLKYIGPSVWNSLPVSVGVAEHLPQLKKIKRVFLGELAGWMELDLDGGCHPKGV